MSRYTVGGGREPTTIFEVAAFQKNLKITCRLCRRHQIVEAVALWWMFYRRGWDGNLNMAVERFYCLPCTEYYRTRLKRAMMTPTSDKPTVSLPVPPEREWKRAVSRYRS